MKIKPTISKLQTLILSIFVSIIFIGLTWSSIRNVYFDIFRADIYKQVRILSATDQDAGDTLHFEIIAITPKHDFIVGEFTGYLYINVSDVIKHNQYWITYKVTDREGLSATAVAQVRLSQDKSTILKTIKP